MIRLRVTEDGVARIVEVKGERVRFGRLADCDVVVAGRGVSREHAELVREGGAWTIRDLGSSNGTFVNDQRVESQRLHPGDLLGIGPEVTVALLEPGAAPPAAAPPTATRAPVRHAPPAARAPELDDPADEPSRRSRRPREARSPKPAGAGSGASNWWTHTTWRLEPRDPGGEMLVIRDDSTTVGRDPAAGFTIDDESVSRMHARLDRSGDALFVTDLKSRNGVHVNDASVLREALHPGDSLVFGDAAYRVARGSRLAWERFGAGAAVLAVLIAGGLGLMRLSDSIGQRAAVRETTEQFRTQAIESTRNGIEASRAGDPELARTHLLHAADLLLLTDLAPPGTSLERPQALFAEIARRLPADMRDFDFARALDPATVESSQARMATLTNREYVEYQLRRYAAELGQDTHVPAGFVDQVWKFVTDYERYPNGMRTMLRRARDVQPRLRRILEAHHLPESFCYVAWVESALDPMQRSPVGAVGLWQLMPATARELGLKVNPANLANDERTSLDKSTAAGADYIARLLRDQGPEYFMLVLASYNRGPGAVDRAKQKIDDPLLPATRKYWYLVEHNLLPEETRNYVPKILAVRLVAEAPERFGFEPWH
jgi:pSer/pThr/pTyr-binding forkhead associated (FHA) protein